MKKLLHIVCLVGLLPYAHGTTAVAGGILSSIEVTPANSTIGARQTKQFTATAKFRDLSTQNISAAGGFSSTGSMGTPRESLAATTLADGKVLISGGSSVTGDPAVQNSAELYDPATETYRYTGNMTSRRWMHTSTLLGDGTVLITGGGGEGYPAPDHDTAELYDPTGSGSFSAITRKMIEPRIFHTATLLGNAANSKVLLVGGATDMGSTATAELYDPSTQTFFTTGSLNIPRNGHSATLLSDGTVLIAGGRTTGNVITDTAEIYDPYDPAGGKFTLLTSKMIVPSSLHTATPLNDVNGNVLIAGGWYDAADGSSVTTNKAQLYNPSLRTFSATGSLATARRVHSAHRLLNGKVLITAGMGIATTQLSSAELYDPVSKTFSAAGSMSLARNWNRTVLLQNGQVYVVGGFTPGGVTTTAELYTPQANWSSSKTSVATINSTGLATGKNNTGTTTITATSGAILGSTLLTRN